jgi:hypothetical protein
VTSIASAEAWRVLQDTGVATRGEFRVYVSDDSSAQGPVLFALDNLGLRHLLIPIRAGVSVEPDEKSSGVRLSARELMDGGVASHFVDVACLKGHLAEVFGHLADEIVEELRGDPGRPATVGRRVLNRWRELLERERPGVLSEGALTGLFGELLILRDLVAQDPAAVRCWIGPSSTRFDFLRGASALEVKTTTSHDQLIVHIHGIEQLDPPAGGDLHLAVVGVERTNAGGHSIPSIISEIRLLGIDALELSSKLDTAGYSEHDAKHYDEIRFMVRFRRLFKVGDDFPRIVRRSFGSGDVPSGVSEVGYSINLTSHAALDDTAARDALHLLTS